MVRVVRVAGPATIVVEHDGVSSEVRLSGIEITDPHNAFAYLTWTIGSSWVMVEDGRVYRSPDALLINDDLVRKGFARSTSGSLITRTPAVYLGELDPEPVPGSPRPHAKATPPSRARPRIFRVRTTRARHRAKRSVKTSADGASEGHRRPPPHARRRTPRHRRLHRPSRSAGILTGAPVGPRSDAAGASHQSLMSVPCVASTCHLPSRFTQTSVNATRRSYGLPSSSRPFT